MTWCEARTRARALLRGRRGMEMLEFVVAGTIILVLIIMIIFMTMLFVVGLQLQKTASITAMEVAATARYTPQSAAACRRAISAERLGKMVRFSQCSVSVIEPAPGVSTPDNVPADARTIIALQGKPIVVRAEAQVSFFNVCWPWDPSSCTGVGFALKREVTVLSQTARDRFEAVP